MCVAGMLSTAGGLAMEPYFDTVWTLNENFKAVISYVKGKNLPYLGIG